MNLTLLQHASSAPGHAPKSIFGKADGGFANAGTVALKVGSQLASGSGIASGAGAGQWQATMRQATRADEARQARLQADRPERPDRSQAAAGGRPDKREEVETEQSDKPVADTSQQGSDEADASDPATDVADGVAAVVETVVMTASHQPAAAMGQAGVAKGQGEVVPASQLEAQIMLARQETAQPAGQGAMTGQGDGMNDDAQMNQAMAGLPGKGGASGQSAQGTSAALPAMNVMPVDGSAAVTAPTGTLPVALQGPAPGQASPLPQPGMMDESQEMDPNVARVAQGLRGALSLKNGSVTIRLNPAELGAVRIEMEVQQGVVRAALQSDHASVRDLLAHQLGRLRESLLTRGLVVDRLEVSSPTPADTHTAQQHAQESPDQGRSRGQFLGQHDGRQSGQHSRHARDGQENIPLPETFGQMVVDMMG